MIEIVPEGHSSLFHGQGYTPVFHRCQCDGMKKRSTIERELRAIKKAENEIARQDSGAESTYRLRCELMCVRHTLEWQLGSDVGNKARPLRHVALGYSGEARKLLNSILGKGKK